jgi:hypothetical protein
VKIIHRSDMPGVVEIAWSNGDRTYGAPSRMGWPLWLWVLRDYIRRVRRRRSLGT